MGAVIGQIIIHPRTRQGYAAEVADQIGVDDFAAPGLCDVPVGHLFADGGYTGPKLNGVLKKLG